MSTDKDKEEVVAIERLELSDDEDDNFNYDGITEDFGDLDNEDDEEDFDNLLRTVNKVEGQKENGNEEEITSVPIEKSYAKVHLFNIDDFIRNFLVQYKLYQSLDTFNTEWYNNIAKNTIQKNKLDPVPDIYVKNQQLEIEIHELKLECERLKNIAKTAKGTWDKFRRERDYHRMNHRRVVQEKEKLLNDIRRLEKQAKLYEPQLTDLKQRYDTALKEKMMMKLDRDKMRAKVETMEQVVSKYEKVESPKQKVVEKKTGKKRIEDTKMPPDNATNPYLTVNYPVPEVGSFTLLKTFKGHTSSISCLAYHPKKHILATGSDDSTFKLWGMPNGDIIMAGEGHEDWIGGIEISPKGTQLTTCSGDGTIKIWDFLSSQCVGTLKDHTQGVWDIGYNYTGDFLVSGSLDQSVKLWDLNTCKCRHSFRGHVDSVNSVLFQPFSNNICSGSADKTVSLWDMKSGLCIQTFYGHTNAINNVTFNLKGDTIASCDADGIVKLWDVRMVAERFSLNSGEHPINKISIDRSGRYLAAASDDGRIKIFDINKCEYVSELSGHEDAVQCVLFEPHGKYLISGGSDNTFRLWGM